MEAAIHAHDISKIVKDQDQQLALLTDINFTIPAGQTLAITGASGSGKTTLLSILAGLDTPTSGAVHLLGQSLFDYTENQRAAFRSKSIGFIFQSFHLLPHLTALENVMLPLELRGDLDVKQKAVAFLHAVGLESRIHQYPLALSGGEQQRVAIARACVTRPALMFADEPTGNLDTQTGKLIWELMRLMQLDFQMTMVVVTHDRLLAQTCDHQLEIAEGKIVSLT